MDGLASPTAGRARHAARRLGPRQFARELPRRDARDPGDVRTAARLHRPGGALARAVARARAALEAPALLPDRRAVARGGGRSVRARGAADPQGDPARVRGAGRRGDRAALSPDQLRAGALGDSRAGRRLPHRPACVRGRARGVPRGGWRTTRAVRRSIPPQGSGRRPRRGCGRRARTSGTAFPASPAPRCSRRACASTSRVRTSTSSSIVIPARTTCGSWAAARAMGSSTGPPSASWSPLTCSITGSPIPSSPSPGSPGRARLRLERDFERFKRELPRDFPDHVREAYHIDLAARYLGVDLPHPIGKGSGQLSLNAAQLEDDAAAGLAFAVLKTVIAEDETGAQAMAAWAIHETRMKVERRGRSGWTVTWKGRGWDRSLAEYLALVRAGRDLARATGMLVVPSVKYHLPRLAEPFHDGEYRHTTRHLLEAWGEPPLLLEKDFSPTLAGDPLSEDRAQIVRWLREVPERIRQAAPVPVRVAVKLMNARFDDAFQLAMMDAAAGADALVCFNRLFDERLGVAYGGWELSDRNLRVLETRLTPHASAGVPALVGTGNICSGRMILEYARRGCESVQLHTFFQLPLSEYPATHGSRPQRALHVLVFHPRDGLVAGMLELEAQGKLERRGGEGHFLDLASDAHRPD